MSGSQLPVDPGLLTTLVFKLAVMASLATMLVRYRRFRHILIFERRALPDRMTFALALGIPLATGVVARLLLNYNAADLQLQRPRAPARRVGSRRAVRRSVRRRDRRPDGRHSAARYRRMGRASLCRRLRLRRRRPSRALSEGSDLALLAVRVHLPAAARV